jgi:hypothetical protein
MDIYTAATNQTSGPSGWEQQGAEDTDDEMEYIRGVEYEAYYKRYDDTFHKIFVNNTFGHVCDVCDRIWFKLDLSLITVSQVAGLEEEFANERDRLPTFKLCSTCRQAVNAKKVLSLSRSNGYKYHEHPTHLPPLDPITKRLISPRLPVCDAAATCRTSHIIDLCLPCTTMNPSNLHSAVILRKINDDSNDHVLFLVQPTRSSTQIYAA